MEAEQVSSLASLLVHSASISIIASEEEEELELSVIASAEPGDGGPAHTAPSFLLSPFSSSTIGLGSWKEKAGPSRRRKLFRLASEWGTRKLGSLARETCAEIAWSVARESWVAWHEKAWQCDERQVAEVARSFARGSWAEIAGEPDNRKLDRESWECGKRKLGGL